MDCSQEKRKSSASLARERFIKNVRRDLNVNRTGADIKQNNSSGILVAQAIRYNDSVDRVKGSTLIEKDQTEWLWEVQGDPQLIDRRLGGQAKRSRDHEPNEEVDQGAVESQDQNPLEITHSIDTSDVDPTRPIDAFMSRITTVQVKPLTKRMRNCKASGIVKPTLLSHEDTSSGPSRNTRFRAGQRRLAEVQAPDSLFHMEQITEAMDGFSVFSNHEIESERIHGFIQDAPPTQTSLTPSTDSKEKIAMWLNRSSQA